MFTELIKLMKIKIILGFLIKEYKVKYFYWELLKITSFYI